MELIVFCLLVFALVPQTQPTEWDGLTPWFTGSGKILSAIFFNKLFL